MNQTYSLTGEMIDNQTIKLDHTLPGQGKVKVTVELLGQEPRKNLLDTLEEIWEGQRRRGHQPPSKKEVDDFLNEERAGWEK